MWKEAVIKGRNTCWVSYRHIKHKKKRIKIFFHSYINNDNKQYACDSYSQMAYLLKTIIELGPLLSKTYNVWYYTYGRTKQHRCALYI